MTPRTAYYDNQNNRVELGNLLAGGEGGEGKVFKVVGHPASVAKIYHEPSIAASREKKLERMLMLPRPDPRIVAWPTATLHQSQRGRVVGFLMPFLPGKEVHELYGPGSRKVHFPAADWAFLIQTARNCAEAFDALHSSGPDIAMGDVNAKNVFVTPDALVRLLDCDSFHITAGGQPYYCGVGMREFTPPELQEQSLRTVIRTHNHDLFGLAVLIFYLLFVGRHPFAGCPLTRGELLPGRAIKEFRFAYSRDAARLQIAPPPHAPPLNIVPPEVCRLFERAFSKLSAQPGARPPGQEWAVALGELQKHLKTCPVDSGHKYSAHLNQCCWCDLMRSGATNYFISVALDGKPLTFVLGPIWLEIDRIPRPSTTYVRPTLPMSVPIVPTVLPANVPARVPPPVMIPRPPEPPAIEVPLRHVPPPVLVQPTHLPPPIVIPRPPEPPSVDVPLRWVPPAVVVPTPAPIVIPRPPEPAPREIPLPQVPPPLAVHLPPLVTVPRDPLNKIVGWTAIGSIAAIFAICLSVFLVALIAPPAARASAGTGCGIFVSVTVFFVICAFTFGAGWIILEIKRQFAIRNANAEREAIIAEIPQEKARRQRAYEASLRQAMAERDAKLAKIAAEKARRQEAHEIAVRQANAKRDAILAENARRQKAYEADVRRAMAEREAILAEQEREKARRQVAYESAVRQANAERDAILAETARENARRRAAYEIAVRQANAEREAILAERAREKARRQEAYEAAVRQANAERDAIIAERDREKVRRRNAYGIVRGNLEAAENDWLRTATGYQQSFDAKKAGLASLKNDFLSLKPQYEREYRPLESNKETDQRNLFLQTQFISDATIRNIGDERKAVLLSHGIETAYDIDRDRILAIKGFKQGLTDNLLAWKAEVTRQFRFNTAAAVTPSELAPLVLKYRQFQQRIEGQLHVGLADLRSHVENADRHLRQLYEKIATLVLALVQAQVDLAVLAEAAS